MSEPIVALRNFANAPKNRKYSCFLFEFSQIRQNSPELWVASFIVKIFFKGTRALVCMWAPVLCILLLYGSCAPGSDLCNPHRCRTVLYCTVLNLFVFVQEHHRPVQYMLITVLTRTQCVGMRA